MGVQVERMTCLVSGHTSLLSKDNSAWRRPCAGSHVPRHTSHSCETKTKLPTVKSSRTAFMSRRPHAGSMSPPDGLARDRNAMTVGAAGLTPASRRPGQSACRQGRSSPNTRSTQRGSTNINEPKKNPNSELCHETPPQENKKDVPRLNELCRGTSHGADDGSRTRLYSLGSCRSTDELHPHIA